MIGIVDLNGGVGDVSGDNIADANDVESPGTRVDVHGDGVDVGRNADRRASDGRRGKYRPIVSFDPSALKGGCAGRTTVTTAVVASGRRSGRRLVRGRLLLGRRHYRQWVVGT